MSLAPARQAADAVLYEGYLLYPYRATSAKNRVRWQFGVLGPPGAAAVGAGEECELATQCLLRAEAPEDAGVSVCLRFLQLQRRDVERAQPDGRYEPVEQLRSGGRTWISWDEAVPVDHELGGFDLASLRTGRISSLEVPGAREVEVIPGGRVVRRRWPVHAEVSLGAQDDDGLVRISIRVANTTDPVTIGSTSGAADPGTIAKDEAIRRSLIGAHLLLEAVDACFVSVIDPPPGATAAASRCHQNRCYPVLAGEQGPGGRTSDVVLACPIILYDFPAVAPQSAGALFDSTEIDEILTLRVMTLTDQEKAAARATDPAAAEIIDRCERMTQAQLQQLHGVMRDPHAIVSDVPGGLGPTQPGESLYSTDSPWWDPAADASVDPDTDAVVIDGVSIARGSPVIVRPSRRADAQDIFFAGRLARVTSVIFDVDGQTHVGVVLADDPAADLHDWYGRSFYFAPDELEPVSSGSGAPDHPAQPKESRS